MLHSTDLSQKRNLCRSLPSGSIGLSIARDSGASDFASVQPGGYIFACRLVRASILLVLALFFVAAALAQPSFKGVPSRTGASKVVRGGASAPLGAIAPSPASFGYVGVNLRAQTARR